MTPATGRVPVPDVQSRAWDGEPPATSLPGEHAGTTATVRREDLRVVAADGFPSDSAPHLAHRVPMPLGDPGADRRCTTVPADARRLCAFGAEAWADRHRDTELTPPELTPDEGAPPYERASLGPIARDRREAVPTAAAVFRATPGPPSARPAAVTTPRVTPAPTRHALRDLVTASRPLPLPAVAAMRFGAAHLPPVHPTGTRCVRFDPVHRTVRVMTPAERP